MNFRTTRERKPKKKYKLMFFIAFVSLIVGATYLYASPVFEKENPKIEAVAEIDWNTKEPIIITLMDNESLKNYQILENDKIIKEGLLKNAKKVKIRINYSDIKDKKAKIINLKIKTTDSSNWNYLKGNSNEKEIIINIDKRGPNLNILSNSYSITKGGSALVIFQANDENLDKIYIETKNKNFKVQPYKEDGYYVSLIAWPFQENIFKATIVAKDKAGNERRVVIDYYQKNKKYRTSYIKAKDKFINGKITDLLEEENIQKDSKKEKLIAVNETMRLANEDLIHNITSKLSKEILYKWKINKFYPLRNGQRVASFGDERFYYSKSKKNPISHSFHVGYDLASTRMADIKTSNRGIVVFTENNGIYGNMPIINHGLGLYSLYGHCSQILVNEGEMIEKGTIIAKTGMSGLALGDHLHFGLLVQGIEVRPVEWFDKDWIRKNIDNIFIEADKIIKGD